MSHGEITGFKVASGGKLTMRRKDNAKMHVAAEESYEGQVYGFHVCGNGTADVTDEGNASMMVGHVDKILELERNPNGIQQKGATPPSVNGNTCNGATPEAKVYIKVRITEEKKMVTEKVDLSDRVLTLRDQFGGAEYGVYNSQGDRLDENKTFAENGVEENSVLKIAKEVTVSSRDAQQQRVK